MRIIDLFAGAGGLTEGFAAHGFEPIFAVELDPAAAATYQSNFGPHIVTGDLSLIPDSAFPSADVVVGGPPCQGFSQLGTRDPSDPRNSLWREFARVVAAVQPTAFVLENVPRFLRSDQFQLLRSWTEPREMLDGYQLVAGVLNAADYGVAQLRKRAIVVGSRETEPTLPMPTHTNPRGPALSAQGSLPAWSTVADAIRDIYDHYPTPSTSNLPHGRFFTDGIPGPFKAREVHLARKPTAISLERYDYVPPGGNRFDLPSRLLPDCWANKPTGTTDVMGRLRWDQPSLTIRTEFFKPEKGRSLHPQYDSNDRLNRPITHWEAARLQSFPDSFTWCGKKTEIARQIGNAVPPRLAEAVAAHLARTVLTSATRTSASNR
jgi:DNA (cytosine-5)-methyltransferase 1